jgi:ABC-2 type transport system permease protein
VSRSWLLFSKLVTVTVFVFLAVLVVAGIGFIAGAVLFGLEPVTSVSGSTLTTTDIVIRTVVTIAYVAVSMLGLASIAVFASTRTDSPLAAALAALATFVTSQVLDLIDAARVIRPYLPTHYWLSFIDLFRDPILWHNIGRGFALQAAYIVVFLGLAWASFSTKDITS